VTNIPVEVPGTASSAQAPDATIALGLGLTNECNLACAFCYRDPTRTDRLSLHQVKSVMERLPVRSVNLGTGENGMHPDFKAILAYLRKKLIKLTITSNGYSVAVLEDDELRALPDAGGTGCTARKRQLGSGSPASRTLCKARSACNHHRGHDEGELSASSGGRASRQTV